MAFPPPILWKSLSFWKLSVRVLPRAGTGVLLAGGKTDPAPPGPAPPTWLSVLPAVRPPPARTGAGEVRARSAIGMQRSRRCVNIYKTFRGPYKCQSVCSLDADANIYSARPPGLPGPCVSVCDRVQVPSGEGGGVRRLRPRRGPRRTQRPVHSAPGVWALLVEPAGPRTLRGC